MVEVPDRTENLPPGRRVIVSVKLSTGPRLSSSIIPPQVRVDDQKALFVV